MSQITLKSLDPLQKDSYYFHVAIEYPQNIPIVMNSIDYEYKPIWSW